jgi:hypothetical protein
VPRATAVIGQCVRRPTFHHWRGACIGTALPPPSALIVAGCDTAHAVVTIAITTITVTVMILRISSSILGPISHFDCEIDYSILSTLPVTAVTAFEEIDRARASSAPPLNRAGRRGRAPSRRQSGLHQPMPAARRTRSATRFFIVPAAPRSMPWRFSPGSEAGVVGIRLA